MASVASFLTGRLKLRLNAAKSAVDRPEHRKVLGFSFKIGPMPKRRIAPAALVRFKERVRDLTRRDCGNSLDTMTKSLARYLIGWRGYLGSVNCRRSCAVWTSGSGDGCAPSLGSSGSVDASGTKSCAVAAWTTTWRLAPPVAVMVPGGWLLPPPGILPCPTLSSPPSACLPLWSGPHNPMNRRVRDPHARWWGRGEPRGCSLSRSFEEPKQRRGCADQVRARRLGVI